MNERIKQIRKKSGLSQDDFGNAIGITRSSVSLLESGRNNPSEQTIRLICTEFNVNEEWLRTGEGEMFNDMDSLDIIHNHFGYMMGNASAQKKAVLAALVEMAYSVPDDKWNYIFQQFNNCLREAREDEEN